LELAEERTKPCELPIGGLEAVGELGELGNDPMCPHFAGVLRDLAQASLDPPTLRLEGELGGVARRQRRLDRIEARRAGAGLGQVQQIRDLVPQRHDSRLLDDEVAGGMGRMAHL